MSLLDRFRSWLGLEVRRFDRNIQTDTENAAEYIKQRTAMHVADMHRDVEAFFDDMLAEQQRHEDKPLTFGPMPAPAALAAPVKQEPEVPAPATPSEVAATEPPASQSKPPRQRMSTARHQRQRRKPLL